MNTGALIITAGLAASVVAGAAEAKTPSHVVPELDGPEIRIAAVQGSAVCGHVGALIAARAALEAGDRAGALEHLRAARWLLSTCEERASGEAEVAASRVSP